MKDAYYFSHDSNARNDQRLMKVRMQYGMEGYGIYFGIIEILRETEDYTLEYPDSIESIAYDLRVDFNLVEYIVNDFNLPDEINEWIEENNIENTIFLVSITPGTLLINWKSLEIYKGSPINIF